ncbi:LysR family transcriptional regulator [Ferrovibrio sp.]|uniref:LysR family transcriptional regulator n=1 Tax=Ferrovibrio sp. TaxID=1917215 RepID=UPI003D1448C8
MNSPSLDIDALRALVLLAEHRSFTRAAEALAATQAAVSLRLKRLEAKLGRRLVERSPRHVALTRDGEILVAEARQVLAAHDAALAALGQKPLRPLRLAISDQTLGPRLPALLAGLRRRHPALRLDVRLGLSRDMAELFEAGEADAAILQHVGSGRGMPKQGEVLLRDRLAWFAAADFTWARPEPLPLIALAAPCGVRAAAITALERGRVAWREAFTGGGVTALVAAVRAGLGIAALPRRLAPDGLKEWESLPALPASLVVLQTRVSDATLTRALRDIGAAIRAD